jgi:anaerobic magnesium-protoporphyrin IX monomethyl ester cyclase
MKRILFIVFPNINKDARNLLMRDYIAFPYGVLSIASYLNKHAKNTEVRILDCNLYDDYTNRIQEVLSEFKPHIVGLSMSYDRSYGHVEKISRMVKEFNINTVVVLGGAAASISYKEILPEQDYIDGICYTEGEIPFTDLVNNCDIEDPAFVHMNSVLLLKMHKSWITRQSLQDGKVPERSFIQNLEVIDIDYSYVNIDDYKMKEAFSPFNIEQQEQKNKKQFFLITSRGCPYSCIFCSSCTGIYNNTIRYASVDAIIRHVKDLVEDYGMNVLTIYDDQLLMNKSRAKELFRQLAQFKIRIECPNGLSVAFIDDELAGLMKRAGMDTVILAIEHGSPKMLKIIRKPLDLKMVKPTVQALRKHNFFIVAFFVIGIPGETEEDRQMTMDFIQDIGFCWCNFNGATPLRGSRLYELCIENGYIDKNIKMDDISLQNYIINAPPHLIKDEMVHKIYMMNLRMNFVYNYRMQIGDYQTAARCFQDVINRVPDHAFAYYFLAKAQIAMSDNSNADHNLRKFYEIIKKDNIWRKYAEHLQLG